MMDGYLFVCLFLCVFRGVLFCLLLHDVFRTTLVLRSDTFDEILKIGIDIKYDL